MANEIIGLSESQKKARSLMVLLAFILFSASFVSPTLASHDPSHLPGTLDSTGTHFQITDSSYLNITLDSTESIKLNLQSIPEMLTMQIEIDPSISPPPVSTQITISGLSPNTSYYLYQDNYHNETLFTPDSNGVFSFKQDISSTHLVFIQPRKGTKFISDNQTGGDCSSIGTWNQSAKTCTLSQDLFETIQIDSDNITLDGNGHTITGTNTGSGVYLSNRTGITIKNLILNNFYTGVYLGNSSNNNNLINNQISNNYIGIYLYNQSNNNNLNNNTVLNSSGFAAALYYSNNNTLNGNALAANSYIGFYNHESSGNKFINNSVSGSFAGIWSQGSFSINNIFNNNNIANNTFGAWLNLYSNSNMLSKNTFTNNYYGIRLETSSGNIITGNTINSNIFYGIYLYFLSANNQIYNNNFSNNTTQSFVSWDSYNNLFNLSLPEGGNYWSNFDTPQEGCSDSNNDKICDSPYIFQSIQFPFSTQTSQDNYPWTIQNGWLAPINQAPTISNLQQLKSDGVTIIQENGITRESTIIFRATLQDPDNDQVKLQVELKEKDRQFDETNFIESFFVSSNTTASITRYGLIPESYHWRARAIDSQGNASQWQEFGTQGNIDFTVGRTIKVAVILAEPSDKSFDPFHNKQYFEQNIIPNVKDYYCEVSFGKRDQNRICQDGLVNLEFEVFDDNGVAYKLEKDNFYYGGSHLTNVSINLTDGSAQPITTTDVDRTVEFTWDAINKADAQIDYNLYDAVISVYPGERQRYDTLSEAIRTQDFMHDLEWSRSFTPLISPTEQAKNWIAIAEQDLIGPWAHEIGHAAGKILTNQTLCDLYAANKCGDVQQWDVMANGGDLGVPQGTIPSHFSSYSKQKLGWLNSEFENLIYGTHFISALVKQNFGGKIKRFNLSDTSYYLLEARTKDSRYSKWDTALSNDALVIYKVKKGTSPNKEVINLIKAISVGSLPLSPFSDPFTNILIDAKNFIYDPLTFKVETEIQSFSLSGYIGATLEPASLIWNSLPDSNMPVQKGGAYPGQLSEVTEKYSKNLAPSLLLARLGDFYSFLIGAILLPTNRYIVIALLLSFILAYIFQTQNKIEVFVQKIVWERLRFMVRSVWSLLVIILLVSLLYTGFAATESGPYVFSEFFTIYLFIFFSAVLIIIFLNSEYKYKFIKTLIKIGSALLIIWIILMLYLIFLFQRSQIQNDSPIYNFSQIFDASSDLDLHVITPSGFHTGVNYQTGQYENQIPGAIASGDLVYDDEWIFVPQGTQVKYYVSSHDVEQFLEQNPDITQQLPSTQETYTLSAMYYDSQSQKYESTPLENQPINPGQTIIHQTQGTTDIQVTPGVIDITPPLTSISFSGTQGLNNWFVSDVQITLSAQDNQDGAGLFKIEYSLDNGTTWQPYQQSFTITQEGIHTILFRSQDLVGNLESANSQELKIDKTAPEAKISFDKDNFQLKIEGLDYLTKTQVTHADKTFVITDQAGHALTLIFSELKTYSKEIKAELSGLQYNQNPQIQTPETEIKYEWSLDKKINQIKELEQKIEVNESFEIEAKYHHKKSETEMKIEEEDAKKTKQTLPGLVIVKLITHQGSLGFEL